MLSIEEYIRPAVCNGHPREQALIRRWWYEVHGARGRLFWEYHLDGCYLDALWLPDVEDRGSELRGAQAPKAFAIEGVPVVLCEAKLRLNPELIGQALVYGVLARRFGAQVRSTVIFAEEARSPLRSAADELGLEVVLD